MEYDFDVVHRVVVRQQAAETLSALHTKRTNDSDINDELSITAVATCKQKNLNKVRQNTP